MCRINRPLILLIVGWTFVPLAAAQDQETWHTDLDAAFQVAREQNRPVLMHFWTEECGPCLNLERTVFNRASVRETLSDFFVPVKINANDMPHLASRYRVETVPKDVILTPEGRELQRMTTPQNAQQYIAQLSAIAFRSGAGTSSGPDTRQVAWNDNPFPARSTDDRTVVTRSSLGGDAYSPPQNRFGSGPADVGGRYGQASAEPYGQATESRPEAAAEPQEVVNRFARQPSSPQSPPNQAARRGSAADSRQRDVADYEQSLSNYDRRPVQSERPVDGYDNSNRVAAQPRSDRSPQLPYSGPPQTDSLSAGPPARDSAPPTDRPPAASPPMGLDGYCPVSLLKKDAWIKGDPKYGVVHRGRIYLFAGPTEKEEFFGSPDDYSPVLAGVDPVELAESGQLLEGQRAHGVVYRKRVYLFSSEDHLKRFWDKPEQYASPIRQAMESGTVDRLFR